MSVPRVLVAPGALASGCTIVLDDAERHHLRTRRIAAGTAVLALDGAGHVADVTLVDSNDHMAVAVGHVQAEPPYPTTVLAIGAGDRDRFIALAERCTELGVTWMIPLETTRARAVDTRVRENSLDRARKRAREACKQSGHAWATMVDDLCPLELLSAKVVEVMPWFLADANGGRCPAIRSASAVGWVIGPEGGLTDSEANYCVDSLSAARVTLGSGTLRFDTAAIAAALITSDRRGAPAKESR